MQICGAGHDIGKSVHIFPPACCLIAHENAGLSAGDWRDKNFCRYADQGAKSAAATATMSRERVRWRCDAVSTTS